MKMHNITLLIGTIVIAAVGITEAVTGTLASGVLSGVVLSVMLALGYLAGVLAFDCDDERREKERDTPPIRPGD